MGDDIVIRPFLDGKYAPITFTVGFLEAPVGRVSDVLIEWKQGICSDLRWEWAEGDLAGALGLLDPLTAPWCRELILATDSPWTAYFNNSLRGTDAFPVVSEIAERLGTRGVILTSVPHTLSSETGRGKGTYGSVQFELFGPVKRESLNYIRSVYLAYEGGKWEFGANGEEQPFEDVDAYKKKNIRERFTTGMLEDYANQLGIRISDSSFYTGMGILLSYSLPDTARRMSIEEARRDCGIG